MGDKSERKPLSVWLIVIIAIGATIALLVGVWYIYSIKSPSRSTPAPVSRIHKDTFHNPLYEDCDGNLSLNYDTSTSVTSSVSSYMSDGEEDDYEEVISGGFLNQEIYPDDEKW